LGKLFIVDSGLTERTIKMSAKHGHGLASHFYKPADLEKLPTLCVGQCCSLKIENPGVRVWLCRVAGGVTIENCLNGRWVTVAGDCEDTGGEL
jgi:hypothetical protein